MCVCLDPEASIKKTYYFTSKAKKVEENERECEKEREKESASHIESEVIKISERWLYCFTMCLTMLEIFCNFR